MPNIPMNSYSISWIWRQAVWLLRHEIIARVSGIRLKQQLSTSKHSKLRV
jgi:hypothetical protein